jgi:hypothetical protein
VPASRTLPSVAPETPESEVLQGNIVVPSSPRSKRLGGGGLGAEEDARSSTLRAGAYDDDDRTRRTLAHSHSILLHSTTQGVVSTSSTQGEEGKGKEGKRREDKEERREKLKRTLHKSFRSRKLFRSK